MRAAIVVVTLLVLLTLGLPLLSRLGSGSSGEAIPLSDPGSFVVGENTLSIFLDVTASAGIDETREGADRLIGQAWGDYDQDGYYDLYLTDPRGSNHLYHNQRDGTFSLAPFSSSVGLPNSMSSGAVFADYDNDGYPDLYVLRRNLPNVLFHNDGGRGFSPVTAEAGVGNDKDSKTASWGDYDGDGYLDLYVANWSCYPDCGRPLEGDQDALYHNNGDGTFTDVTRLLGPKTLGAGFVASFVDFDSDGDADIYLVNDVFINPVGNALWRNDGPGCGGWCFTEISEEARADTKLMGMGLATSDYDNDGDFDFFLTNAGPMALLQNLGDGTFADVAGPAGVDVGGDGIGWGTVAFDYDNDGFRDFYVALTDMLPDQPPTNPLFRNLGDGTFDDVTAQSGLGGEAGRTLGVAYADYDNDGWVDIVIGDYERGYTLFRNQAGMLSTNSRLAVRLIGGGPVSRDAVGARVSLTTTDGVTQVQEVQCGSSLGAGNASTLYFGLGQAEVENLTIRWPDGKVQQVGDLQPDYQYTIEYLDESGD